MFVNVPFDNFVCETEPGPELEEFSISLLRHHDET